jgi:hypothetical protein
LPSKEDTDKDVSPPPLHLIVPVDLCKCSGSKEKNPYLVFVDSDATYNFISKSVTDKIRLEVVKARIKRNRKKMPPLITMVTGKPLHATAVIRQMVQICDSAGTKRSHAINIVIADIAYYDMMLGMTWLQKQNPDVHRDTGVWHWPTRTKAEDRPIRLVRAGAFVATTLAEYTHGYVLHVHELGIHPDYNTAGDSLMPTKPQPAIPKPYRAYGQVVSEKDLESMPSHGPQDLAIELINLEQSLWYPIYNLSENEIDTLRSYLKVQLKQA